MHPQQLRAPGGNRGQHDVIVRGAFVDGVRGVELMRFGDARA
jgi:hypothetical protein